MLLYTLHLPVGFWLALVACGGVLTGTSIKTHKLSGYCRCDDGCASA